MILISSQGDLLSITGHANADPRVCAAVCAMTGMLHVSYPNVQQPQEGQFTWDSSQEKEPRARSLVFNFFRLLAQQYPREVKFQE